MESSQDFSKQKCTLAVEAMISVCVKKKLRTVVNSSELFYFLWSLTVAASQLNSSVREMEIFPPSSHISL